MKFDQVIIPRRKLELKYMETEEGVGEDVEKIVPHMYVEQTIARQNFIGFFKYSQ